MDNLVLIAEYLLIGVGGVNLGIAGYVAIRFMFITYYVKRPGLKPWHIWLIGTSYSLLTIMAITSRLNDLGNPTWRWPLYCVAVLTGTAALVIMAKYQWRLPPMKEQKKRKP